MLLLLLLLLLLLGHSKLLLLHLLRHSELLLLHEGLIIEHLLLLLSAVAGVLAIVYLLLVLVAILFLGFLDRSKLLMAHGEVSFLRVLDQAIDALNFKLVSMDLSLVVLQLRDEIPQLLATILEVLLILD